MRISCPHCGPRSIDEFAYRGDADAAADRPPPDIDDPSVWSHYVYDRANPAGEHIEIWQHVGGCRKHLRVQRDTGSNLIKAVFVLGARISPNVESDDEQDAVPASDDPAQEPSGETGADA